MTDINAINEHALDIESLHHKIKAICSAVINRGNQITAKEIYEINACGNEIREHAERIIALATGRDTAREKEITEAVGEVKETVDEIESKVDELKEIVAEETP